MLFPPNSAQAYLLHTLLALCLASSALVVQADVLHPRAGYIEPPPEQTLVVELESRLDGADWGAQEVDASAPANDVCSAGGKDEDGVGECMVVMLHFFDDGSMRPTGQLLDEECLLSLADWQELNTNGSVAQFSAQTARGAVELRLAVRWLNPPSQGLSRLTRAELAQVPELSQEQLAQQAQQRESLVRAMKQDAVDRAWRAARLAK